MFPANLQILGNSKFRTVINSNGRLVNITDGAATAGINMVGSDMREMLGIFGNIVERELNNTKTGCRVIVFHDSELLEGISSAYPDVILLGGKVPGAALQAGDGGLVADILHRNPRQSVFINLRQLEIDDAARFIGDFASAYSLLRNITDPAEIIATVGLGRLMPRKRYNTGDTRAVRDTMRQQQLAPELNLRVINVTHALSEIPYEFHTNTPNIMLFRIAIPKHYRDLKTHITNGHMHLIELHANDADAGGVMHMGRGYASYFNPSDLPNNVGFPLPYIIEQTELKSKIGQTPDAGATYGKEKLRRTLMSSLLKARKDRADKEAAAAEAKIRAKLLEGAKRRLMAKGIAADLLASIGLGSVAATASTESMTKGKGINNQLSCGTSIMTHLRADGKYANEFNRANVAMSLAAYDTSDGVTLKGQKVDVNLVMKLLREQDLSIFKKAMNLGNKPGLPGAQIAIAASIIARTDRNKAMALLDMLAGESELQKQTVAKVKTLWKARGAASDQVFAVLMQAADAVQTGRNIKRFTSAMPKGYIVANDDTVHAKAV